MTACEEVFHLASDTGRLLATFHHAAGKPRFGVLFVHPFGEEKKCAHRAFVETARALACRDVASLRFDLSGCGDSEGSFEEATFSDWMKDISAAWDELRRRSADAPLVLLGLRMGAALASRVCAAVPHPSGLLLWQPVVNGKTEFSSELRRLLIQQMMIVGKSSGSRQEILAAFERGESEAELDGYPVTAALYNDICSISLSRDADTWPAATGIVQFSRTTRAIQLLAQEAAVASTIVDVPPIWIRSDFMPNQETGERLAAEGVLSFIDPQSS